MVHWLRLRSCHAGGVGLILGQGTKIPHAERHGQNFLKMHCFLLLVVLSGHLSL